MKKHIKGKQLSLELKKQIIDDYFTEGLSYRQIGEKYHVNFKSVGNVCTRYEQYGEAGFGRIRTTNQGYSSNAINPHRKENAILKKQVKELEVENKILKKLKEFLDQGKK